jgi:hypothetical protein
MQGFSDFSNNAQGRNIPGKGAEDYYNNFNIDEISPLSNG